MDLRKELADLAYRCYSEGIGEGNTPLGNALIADGNTLLNAVHLVQSWQRAYTAEECTIDVWCEPEPGDPKDYLCSELDIEWVKDNSWREWSWCIACVKVTAPDGSESTQYLGCCSYENKQQFIDGGYYDDMIAECLAEINS